MYSDHEITIIIIFLCTYMCISQMSKFTCIYITCLFGLNQARIHSIYITNIIVKSNTADMNFSSQNFVIKNI